MSEFTTRLKSIAEPNQEVKKKAQLRTETYENNEALKAKNYELDSFISLAGAFTKKHLLLTSLYNTALSASTSLAFVDGAHAKEFSWDEKYIRNSFSERIKNLDGDDPRNFRRRIDSNSDGKALKEVPSFLMDLFQEKAGDPAQKKIFELIDSTVKQAQAKNISKTELINLIKSHNQIQYHLNEKLLAEKILFDSNPEQSYEFLEPKKQELEQIAQAIKASSLMQDIANYNEASLKGNEEDIELVNQFNYSSGLSNVTKNKLDYMGNKAWQYSLDGIFGSELSKLRADLMISVENNRTETLSAIIQTYKSGDFTKINELKDRYRELEEMTQAKNNYYGEKITISYQEIDLMKKDIHTAYLEIFNNEYSDKKSAQEISTAIETGFQKTKDMYNSIAELIQQPYLTNTLDDFGQRDLILEESLIEKLHDRLYALIQEKTNEHLGNEDSINDDFNNDEKVKLLIKIGENLLSDAAINIFITERQSIVNEYRMYQNLKLKMQMILDSKTKTSDILKSFKDLEQLTVDKQSNKVSREEIKDLVNKWRELDKESQTDVSEEYLENKSTELKKESIIIILKLLEKTKLKSFAFPQSSLKEEFIAEPRETLLSDEEKEEFIQKYKDAKNPSEKQSAMIDIIALRILNSRGELNNQVKLKFNFSLMQLNREAIIDFEKRISKDIEYLDLLRNTEHHTNPDLHKEIEDYLANRIKELIKIDFDPDDSSTLIENVAELRRLSPKMRGRIFGALHAYATNGRSEAETISLLSNYFAFRGIGDQIDNKIPVIIGSENNLIEFIDGYLKNTNRNQKKERLNIFHDATKRHFVEQLETE
jgi:hypothetical protein